MTPAAEKCLTAAALLRDWSKVAGDKNGWGWTYDYGAVRDAEDQRAILSVLHPGAPRGEAAGEYVALVGPVVGLALADWLVAEADEYTHGHDSHDLTHALRVADAILAGEVSNADR